MELFKNKVGRPSNETIRKRRTAYVLIFVAVVGIIGTGVFYVRNIFNNNAINSKGKNASVQTNTIAKSGDVASEIKLGGDGKITNEDIEIIKRLVAGETINGKTKDTLYKTGTKNKLADIDGDGKVDATDIKLVSEFVVKNTIKDVDFGDINKNGEYDLIDLELLKQYVNDGKQYLSDSQLKLADLNKDGKVTQGDVLLLNKFMVSRGTCNNKNTNIDATLGDVNCDGKINISDVSLIKSYKSGSKIPNAIQEIQANIDETGMEYTENGKRKIDKKITQEDVELLQSILNTGKTYSLGDINKDGKVDSKDTKKLGNYLNKAASLDAVQLDLADLDRNGRVNSSDKKILERIISGYGDVCNAFKSTGDGKLTWEDYELVKSHVTGNSIWLSANQRAAADIDGNNRINSTDIQLVIDRINDKFKTYTGVANNVNIGYSATTKVLSLDGTASGNILFHDANIQEFKKGEKYQVKLEYISGSVEKNGYGYFTVDVRKRNGQVLSTRNFVDVSFPTSTNKVITKTLSISDKGEREGGQLYIRITKDKKLKFKNYKIKVSVVNTSLLTAIFEPNGSLGEKKIVTCNTLGKNSCTVKAPAIDTTKEFKTIGWSTDSNEKTKEVTESTNITLTNSKVYYAITKSSLPYVAFFEKNNAISIGSTSQSCYRYNGSIDCKINTPSVTPKQGYNIIGWGTNEDSVNASIKSSSNVNLKRDSVYYAITGKTISVTFDKNKADSLSYYKSSCIAYNNGCKLYDVPFIYSTGNVSAGFGERKNDYGYSSNSYIKNVFYSNKTLYAHIDNSITITGTKRNVYREERIMGKPIYFEGKVDKNGDLVLKEDGRVISVSKEYADNYYNALLKASNEMPYLFLSNGTIFCITQYTMIKDYGSGTPLGITFDPSSGFANVDLKVGNYSIDSYFETAIHELGHATDFYYKALTGKMINEQENINKLYEKYKKMPSEDRPMRDYSYTSVNEFVADLFLFYYLNGVDHNYSFSRNRINKEMLKEFEPYIIELKKWVKI